MARLEMSFFGAFQLTSQQQPVTNFRSSNTQGLLVYLALQSGRPHAREVLAALFWPEEPAASARNNLRQSLHQLRKLLGDVERPDHPYLLASRQTVQFRAESDYALDVGQFLNAIEAGDLECAVALYCGELLPGFTCDSIEFESWLRQEREYLHRLALEAMFELAQDQLAHGHLDQAQMMARRQVSLEPWRERAHRQLMRAYALAGDRASALAQYEACRQQLWHELAAEPVAETTALAEEIRTGRYAPLLSDEPLPPPKKQRHNLPASTTPFIGRERDIAQLHALLTGENRRLVTVAGPGGIGKTRLALATARPLLDQFRDGVYFVDLAPLAAPAEVPLAIAAALDYTAPDQTRELFPQLLGRLAQAEMLLILDNCEHLRDGAPLVSDLLQACPQVAILTTSRQRLKLASESVWDVSGLDYPTRPAASDAMAYSAVQLFVDNARRARAGFELDGETQPAVIHICQLVQGMPLALVLAASWSAVLMPAEIAAELEAGIDLLAADMSDLPPRQRSIEAVFASSWQMMSADEQRVLARISVFRGGFTREAAEQVAGANLNTLLSLADKSMLRREADGGRFVIHELVRQFAAQQRQALAPGAIGDGDGPSLAHCRYYARLMAREARQGLSLTPHHLPRHYAAEEENIRQAWTYALEHGVLPELAAIGRAMVAFGFARGLQSDEIATAALRALRRRDVPEQDPVMLMMRLLEIKARSGYDDRERIWNELVELAELLPEPGVPELRMWVYQLLSWFAFEGGRDAGLRGSDEKSETLYWAGRAYEAARQTEDDSLAGMVEAFTICMRIWLAVQDERDRFRLEEILAELEGAFPVSFIVYLILWSLSKQYRADGAYERAIYYARRSLNLPKRWQDPFFVTLANQMLASIYLEMGDPCAAGDPLCDSLDWHVATAQVWQTLGAVFGTSLAFPQLLGGAETVVPLLSMVYHHLQAVQFHRQLIADARPALEAEMGGEAFTAAWEAGKTLELETAVETMRSALTGC
jgi:predicted ATPase/DNA-binding SARP family transcriptional activator